MSNYRMAEHLNGLFADMIDPNGFLESIWEKTFPWQKDSLNPAHKNLMLNCARQSGKSTIVSGVGLHTAKYTANSVNLIVSPSEKQSKETMKKVEDFINIDPELKALRLPGDSKFEKEFRNGSRIIALPGTEKSVRGYSKPTTIILDEAARVPDMTYKALRPMRTGSDESQLILLSTPWNEAGFFFEEWTKNPTWKKIYVVPRWTLNDDDELIERPPEEEFQAACAEKGISGYYSPRHTFDFLYSELMSLGPIWFRREYCCEFLSGMETIFSMDLIESAYTSGIKTHYTEEDVYSPGVKVANFLKDWSRT